jgi:hypothetical protein
VRLSLPVSGGGLLVIAGRRDDAAVALERTAKHRFHRHRLRTRVERGGKFFQGLLTPRSDEPPSHWLDNALAVAFDDRVNRGRGADIVTGPQVGTLVFKADREHVERVKLRPSVLPCKPTAHE